MTHHVERQDYSGLEVDGRQHFSDPEVTRPEYPTLEVTHGFNMAEGMQTGNLQAYHSKVRGDQDAEGKIAVVGEGLEINEEAQSPGKSRRIFGLPRRAFLLIAVLTLLLLVGAIVGGVVGGTASKRKGSTTTATGSAGTSSAAPSATPTAANTGISLDSNLATLAWTVSSTRYQYRVYYQDDDNSIKESAYDSSTGSWNVSTIVDGAEVVSGTSLAASSSKYASSGSNGVDVNLYYIDTDLNIALVSAPLGVWTGTPGSSTQPTSKSAHAKLAAYYHECGLCSNTTLLAHALDGTVILYNGTSPEAWTGEQSTIVTDALPGSEVSLQPYRTSQWPDQVNLYYQRGDMALTLSSWFSWQYQLDSNLDLSDSQGWQYSGNNAVVGTMVANASFATLYFGDNNGSPAFVEVLTSGANLEGTRFFEWTANSWMAPIEPQAMQNVTKGTALAAHFYQRAYALVNGILTQFAIGNDGSDWTVNAGVPTL